jgi:iron-sulfur cluster assembly protein
VITLLIRIKEIMSNAEKDSLGVRVSVKAGGCAGMSYVMEYTKEVNPNDEVIEEKGVKFLLIQLQLCIFLELKWIIKKRNYPQLLSSIIPMKLSVVVVESPLK